MPAATRRPGARPGRERGPEAVSFIGGRFAERRGENMIKPFGALIVLMAALALLAGDTAAREARPGLIEDRITFDSSSEDFEKIFPVTENLNQILAEISKREIEVGRPIPNFIVYPYNPDRPEAEPFTLLWKEGQYVKRTKLPAEHEAILIYDPRRLSAGDEEIEEGKRVEYRHFVVRYRFNSAPDLASDDQKPASPLEPTDSSIYISRAVLGEGESSRASAGKPTHQLIIFPRIIVPKEYDGQDVSLLALQFESALHYGPVSETESEGGAAPGEAVETSEQSFFLVD